MADNTPVTNGTGDTIRDKDRAGVKTQIVGLDLGIGTGTESLMSGVMPISDADVVSSGTISAADAVVAAPSGNGALLSGASTANSYVSLSCPGGDSAWNIQLTGTFGGTTVYFEESLDSTTGVDGNWIAVNGRQTGVVNTVLSYGVTTAGVYRGNTSGAKYLRVRAVGGAAISIAAILRISGGTGAIFLNASVPAGSNVIGGVAGDIAHDAVDSGNPVKMGGVSRAVIPTATGADGRRVNAWFDRYGKIGMFLGNSATPAVDAFSNANFAYNRSADDLNTLLGTADYLFDGSTWNRPRGIDALTAAPNVDTGIAAVGVGPGWDRKRTSAAMAVTLNSATTIVVNGAAAIMFALKFNTVTVGTGTIVFEVTADETNWVTAPTVMKMPDQTAIAGTYPPVNNTQYIVGVAGWRQARIRVASALTSGTIDVITTATAIDAVVTLADRQRVNSFGAVFRLAEAASSLALSFTHVANTTKQYATIHHAATALKLVKIRKVTFWLYSTSAALDGVLELRRIITAPATGAPAITPAAHDPNAGAAETTCLALPGTQATDTPNSPVASIGINLGITTAPTTNQSPTPFVLFDADKYTDMQALIIRPLALEGWAVSLRTVGTPVVKATIEVQFTEE